MAYDEGLADRVRDVLPSDAEAERTGTGGLGCRSRQPTPVPFLRNQPKHAVHNAGNTNGGAITAGRETSRAYFATVAVTVGHTCAQGGP